MEKQRLIAQATELSSEAGVTNSLHGYFLTAFPRLYKASEIFGLFERPLGDVLEVGPFYGYLPFFLRSRASSYVVLEGDDPVVYPLKPLYERHKIDLQFVDFFEIFGPHHGVPHKLSAPDAQYDSVLCWETMEHFNFNPIKFVREIFRVLKPGGRAYITVPNKSSFSAIFTVLFGYRDKELIEGYFTYEDYESNGKKCFYGFHWREYSAQEIAQLFSTVGFKVEACGTFTFGKEEGASTFKRLRRLILNALQFVFPGHGTSVYLMVEKPIIS